MEKLGQYQIKVSQSLGSLETKHFSDSTIKSLLEKLDTADKILKELKADDLEDSNLFENLLAYAHELSRAERAKERMEDIQSELMTLHEKRMRMLATKDEFFKFVQKYVGTNQKVQIMEQIDAPFIFDLIIGKILGGRKIHPDILALDPNEEYRIDEIEKIDEVEALKVQKATFDYVLKEEEKLTNYSNDYFFHRANGIRLIDADKNLYKIYSITIGMGSSYNAMFAVGDVFEFTDGHPYKVKSIETQNRFPTKSVVMGRIDDKAELKLRVRVPLHFQAYTCVRQSK
jgi:uncharacterized protein YdcH (DUF465 family)